MTISQTLFWFLLAFFSGALPFSVWVGRWGMGADIRQYGDGNPGAFNVFRAGGKGWGWAAILLDGLKGAIPVGLANFWIGLDGWPLAVVALAPVLGHAFSPLLQFRGGKALAVTFGVWTGLTLWLAPTMLGLGFAIGMKVFGPNGRAVMLGQGILLAGLAIAGLNEVWMAVWLGTTILLGWKHRGDFRPSPNQG